MIALLWLDKNFYLLNNKAVSYFWMMNKIENNDDLYKIIDNNERITYLNSPYMNYARMVVSQKKHITNGVFLDGAHMCYLDYIDLIVSDDNEFNILNNNVSLDKYLETINIKLEH